jgi:flagellar hook-associated protein 1 FlgK
MISTFFGLEIARRGLMAGRSAMDVTAHNLANASTEGYTRQEPVFSATDPYTLPNLSQRLLPGQLGTGTEVSRIRRVRDEFLDNQVRFAESEDGFWQARQDALQKVEALFPEPSEDTGLGAALARFFDSWHELNNDPGDPGLKAAVKEAGEELAVQFRHLYQQLEGIRSSQEDDIILKAKRINEIAEELGGLNKAISLVAANGNQPNDLLDRRDALLDELAGIISVGVDIQDNGTVAVTISNSTASVPLVSQNGDFNHIDLNPSALFDATSDKLALKIPNSSGASVETLAITDDAAGYKLPGSLAGAESVRWGIASKDGAGNLSGGYLYQLNELAKTIIARVNALHGSQPFFSVSSSGAEDIDLDNDIKSDVRNVNGEAALAIAQLREDSTAMSGVTFEAYYRGLVSGIGADTDGSGHQADTAKAVLDQLKNLRQSVAGVSLDEELTRLTQFQYAYQASARIVTVLDSMLDTIINRMGVT